MSENVIPLKRCGGCSVVPDKAQGIELKLCSVCRKVSYCSRDCQVKDWKAHKLECKKKKKKKCKRCTQPYSTETVCQVPHPVHHREDGGSIYSGGRYDQNFSCGACGGFWTEHRKLDAKTHRAEEDCTIVGQEFCFEGRHTLKPVPSHDERVVKANSLDLVAGPDLQRQINELPTKYAGVKRLTISTGNSFNSPAYEFNVKLPKLKVLQIDGANTSKIVLNQELTPKLEQVKLINFHDENGVVFDVKLPSLKNFECHYWTNMEDHNVEELQTLLDYATELETFETYKLWAYGTLRFASHELKLIKLHRSDALSGIEIWSPALRTINVQACYGLDTLTILDDHPVLKKKSERKNSTGIIVNMTNCSESEIQRQLRKHKRVSKVVSGEDTTAGIGGSGMEAMLKNMRASMFPGF